MRSIALLSLTWEKKDNKHICFFFLVQIQGKSPGLPASNLIIINNNNIIQLCFALIILQYYT